MQVLIADDDAVSRKLLERYLQKWGHEVAVAKDGQGGVDAVPARRLSHCGDGLDDA
jgi:CheY-like chemotaxis protein